MENVKKSEKKYYRGIDGDCNVTKYSGYLCERIIRKSDIAAGHEKCKSFASIGKNNYGY